MTDINANLAIQSICSLRRIQMLNNVPPSRVELEASPYSIGLKKKDLDMRRKAEILKYKNAYSKTNSLTKNQSWSQLVNGNALFISNSYINRYTNLETINQKVISCGNGKLVLTNPSASNVPPDPNVPFLYNDSNVPLYQFINPKDTRSYGIINPEL